VFDRCRVEDPPLFDVGPGQQAACWLAEGGRALPVLPTHHLGEVVQPGIAAPDHAPASEMPSASATASASAVPPAEPPAA
jgi:hypothetical protein